MQTHLPLAGQTLNYFTLGKDVAKVKYSKLIDGGFGAEVRDVRELASDLYVIAIVMISMTVVKGN